MSGAPLPALSLCSGVEGFGLGLERSGLVRVRWAAEKDPYAQAVIRRHFPSTEIYGDIRDVGAELRGQARVVFGGWPCQPHSKAGARRGADDERDLWPEVRRVLGQVGPELFIGENVAGLTSSDNGHYFRGVVGDLLRLGFTSVEWDHLPAMVVGAPHLRDRLVLIARRDGRPTWATSAKDTDARMAAPRIEWPRAGVAWANGSGEPRPMRREPRWPVPARPLVELAELWPTPRASDHRSGRVSRETWEKNARPLTEAVWMAEGQPTAGMLNPEWEEWLMGFPVGWTRREGPSLASSPSLPWKPEPAIARLTTDRTDRVDRVRCLGNAVVPAVAELFGRDILKSQPGAPIMDIVESRFARSTEIQTLLFDAAHFNVATAKEWAVAHDFKARKVDGGGPRATQLRVRQHAPGRYEPGTFRTIELRPGVQAVIGVPKASSLESEASRDQVDPSRNAGGDARPSGTRRPGSRRDSSDIVEACCGCRERLERLPTVRATRTGTPSCGCRHQALLGIDAELVERMEAPSGPALRSGRPGANLGVVWRYYTTSVYADSDLPVLCVRECLQNASDAIDDAVRARQIKRADGAFGVSWDADRTLTIEDNGIGMDPDTFFGKFLTIGESGKRGGGASAAEGGGGKGGFGVAKAVILGTSSTFRWKVHTRDKLFVSTGFDEDVKMYEAPMRQGTAIMLYDVAEKFVQTWSYSAGRYAHVMERLRALLSLNDLDLAITADNSAVPRHFPRKGGSALKISASWGPETTAAVKVYKRADKGGAYYIRLNGLFQFKKSSVRGKMKGDVVIDLETTVRPDDPRGLPYPLNAARDALTTEARIAFDEVVGYAETETESLTEQREYDALDPELAETEEERHGAEDIAQATKEAFDDPDVVKALRDAAGGVDDFYREREKAMAGATPESPVTSTAPRGTEQRGPMGLSSEAVGAGPVGPSRGAAALSQQIARVLDVADRQRQAQGGARGGIITADVRQALQIIAEAEPGSIDDEGVTLQIIGRALEGAERAALGPGGGGLLQTAQISAAWKALQTIAPGGTRPVTRNPFGSAAAVLISRKRYKRPKARRFLQNYAKWIPYLVAWDGTLRMIAHEIKMRAPFAAGFVLDDGVVGLARQKGGRLCIYVNPDVYVGVVKSSAGRPLALAAFLHNLACHELAHANGRMGDGHDEEFVAVREEMAQETAHLLPAIAALAQRSLRVPESPEQKETRSLRERLDRLRGDLATARAELRRVRKGGGSVPPTRRRPVPPSSREQVAENKSEAGDLIDIVAGELASLPPRGIEAAYVVSFFRRHRDTLVAVATQALAELRAGGVQVSPSAERDVSVEPSPEALGDTLPRQSAGLAIVRDNALLLVHPTNASWQGTYSIPKGTVERDEQIHHAALREVVEETGLDLYHLRELFQTPRTHGHRFVDHKGKHVVYWIMDITGTTWAAALPDVFPRSQLQTSEVDWAGFLPITGVEADRTRGRMVPYQLAIVDEAVKIIDGRGRTPSEAVETLPRRSKAGALVERVRGALSAAHRSRTYVHADGRDRVVIASDNFAQWELRDLVDGLLTTEEPWTVRAGREDERQDGVRVLAVVEAGAARPTEAIEAMSRHGRWEIVYGHGTKEYGRFGVYGSREAGEDNMPAAEAFQRKYKPGWWVHLQPNTGRWDGPAEKEEHGEDEDLVEYRPAKAEVEAIVRPLFGADE